MGVAAGRLGFADKVPDVTGLGLPQECFRVRRCRLVVDARRDAVDATIALSHNKRECRPSYVARSWRRLPKNRLQVGRGCWLLRGKGWNLLLPDDGCCPIRLRIVKDHPLTFPDRHWRLRPWVSPDLCDGESRAALAPAVLGERPSYTHKRGVGQNPHFTCFQFPRRQCSTRLTKSVQLQLPHRPRALVGTEGSPEPLLTGTAIRHQSRNQILGSSLRRSLAAMSRQGSTKKRCEPQYHPPAASGVKSPNFGPQLSLETVAEHQAIRSELL